MLIPAILTIGAVLLGTGVVLDAPAPSWLALGLAAVVAALCLAPPTTSASASTSDESEDDVRVIPRRRRFHTAHCPVLVGQTTGAYRLDAARAAGFTPCSRCARSVPGQAAVDGESHAGDVARRG